MASLVAYAWLLGRLNGLASATWIPRPDGFLVGLLPGPLVQPPELSSEVRAQAHAAAAVDFLVGVSALFLVYLLAVWLARGRATVAGVAVVLGLGALFQAVAALAPWSLSGDVYSYAIYGRMFAVYGGSPYLEVPAQYPGDPFYDHVYWKFVPSFYGPLWTLVSGALALLAGHDVGLAVLLFRLLAGASAVAAAVVALLVLRRTDPERSLVGAALVAWCPFVVIECGLSAHNDALMVLLIVVGLTLAWARRPALAVGAVVLAGLVKLTALALLPLLGLYLLRTAPSWRARLGVVARSALVSVPLVVAVVAPVWAGPATLAVGTLGSGADRYVNSLAEVALGELRVRLGASRDDLEVPLQFSGWWVGSHTETLLYVTRTGDDSLLVLPQWSELLVVGPERAERLRVFDPTSRLVGYVDVAALGPIDPPEALLDDPEVQARMQGPRGSWDLNEANHLIRLAGWGAFVLALAAGAALGTATLAGVALAWAWLCLVLAFVTLAWFWPWYVLWGLLPAALVPRSRGARLTVWLSWGVLLAYVGLGFADTRFWFLQNYRALAMFGLPLVLFGADEAVRGLAWGARRLARRRRPPARSESAQTSLVSASPGSVGTPGTTAAPASQPLPPAPALPSPPPADLPRAGAAPERTDEPAEPGAPAA